MSDIIQAETVKVYQDANYKKFLSDIKKKVKTAQIRAALAANKELISFYWQLGRDITRKQKQFHWGEKFLIQFSDDLKKEFPGLQGFSVTNLKRMRIFAEAYPDFGIGPQLVDQLPWGHIFVILHKVSA